MTKWVRRASLDLQGVNFHKNRQLTDDFHKLLLPVQVLVVHVRTVQELHQLCYHPRGVPFSTGKVAAKQVTTDMEKLF